MRFSYNLLIISILIVCIWFTCVSVKKKAYYRYVFLLLMIMSGIMYLNHFGLIAMEEKYISYNQVMRTVERCIYYFAVTSVYALFAFFIYCIVDHINYWSLQKKLAMFIPAILIDILIVTSPWTHLIFYIENDVVYLGPLYLLLNIVRAGYALPATLNALRKRKLLPDIFGKCVLIDMVFSFMQFIVFLVMGSESLYFSTLIVSTILLLLAITVVEFYKDDLTGLLNEEAFRHYTSTEIKRKNNKKIYLIKIKNYQYLKENCHEIPLQETIVQMGEYLKKDVMLPAIYYIGSGKFIIIVHKRDSFSEEAFLRKMRERLTEPFNVHGASVQLSLFIAIMNMQNGKITGNNFYKYLTACDEMKYRSSDSVEVIQGDSFGIDQIQRYYNVEEAIERALIEHEYKIFYQPIYSVEKKKIISAEALIRLNDRILGFVSPEEFIPISESNGKILEISDFVLDSVFRFIKEYDIKSLGLEFIEINLSMMQCMDKNLPSKLQHYLDKYMVSPQQVNLEITETATSFDEERLKKQLEKIKKLGFSFALDDYGTGYSNLVRVMEYPVDLIKLDKSIVWSAFHDRDNFITMKNLIAMFHDVRRKIVAEGVESEEQMEALIELGCDYLQGYYYCKPVYHDTFVDFVEKFNQ